MAFIALFFSFIFINNYILPFTFPENFIWGTATAEYQISGMYHCPNSNWAQWERTTFDDGSPHISHDDSSQNACDHWNNYQTDIECMRTLGVQAYRFSVEWSKIEPKEGFFDETALNHYVDLCKALHAANIKPVITLHHFTHPLWFEKKGAFEKAENIDYFVRFCTHVFNLLNKYVYLWCTINEPAGFVVQGYLRGIFPPGKKNPVIALMVLQNLMRAHVATYQAIKKLPAGNHAQIGLVKSVFQFEPYHHWSPIERIICSIAHRFYNKSIINFFKTGWFKFNLPLVAKTAYYDPDAPRTLDFIGLNYYSHIPLRFNLFSKNTVKEQYPRHEIMTDMPNSIYPEGFYKAIKYVAQLNVPIYITENGIADAQDNRRELFIKQYLEQLARALKDGYDVRGYFYWSLLDNFEWAEGKAMRFGLYHVDYATQKRTLRSGSQQFINVVRANRYL